MRRKLRLFIPRFLKNLDQKLLINYPGIWSTKIHFVVFYGLVGLAIMGMYALSLPVDLSNVPDPNRSFRLASIPVGVFFLFWVYLISSRQVEKEFGHGWKNSFQSQFIYALAILIIAAIPVLSANMMSFKIRQKISKEQLITDINILNLGDNIFVTDIEEYEYSYGEREKIRYPQIKLLGYRRYCINDQEPDELWQIGEIRRELNNFDTDEKKLDLITRFIKVFNQYSPKAIALSPQMILENYRNESWDHQQTQYHYSKYDVNANLKILRRAHSNTYSVGYYVPDKDILLIYFLMMTITWISLQVFLKTNRKIFVLSILIFIVTVMIAVLINGLLIFVFAASEKFVFLILSGFFFFYVVQSFLLKNSGKAIKWKLSFFSAVTMA
ncbi:MAG: hypothetical protein KDD99_27485, partial [Bacteroidetes bacterium]|nr:hypothetical protein [Bacteroidota bacterium]